MQRSGTRKPSPIAKLIYAAILLLSLAIVVMVWRSFQAAPKAETEQVVPLGPQSAPPAS